MKVNLNINYTICKKNFVIYLEINYYIVCFLSYIYGVAKNSYQGPNGLSQMQSQGHEDCSQSRWLAQNYSPTFFGFSKTIYNQGGTYMFIDSTGVISVAVEGSDKDQLVVIGEGVDSANLTCSLRKKLCYATLLSVEEVKEKQKPEEKPKPKPKDEKPKKPENTSSTSCSGCPQLPICPQYPPFPTFYEVAAYDPSPSYCCIM